MPATKKLSKKALDKQIDSFYNKHGQNVEINIMDTITIMNAGRAAYAAGGDVEQAIIDSIAQCRKN